LGGATAVRFGDVPAVSFTVACVSFDDPCSESEITAVSPAHAEGIVDVTVTTPGGTSTTGDCGDSGESGQSGSGPPCDKFNYYGELRGGTWATTGVQAKGGAGQLTVLRSGKVLLTGPLGNETYDFETGRTAVSGAELYDPATGRWSSCSEAAASQDCPGPMVATRYPGHTATLLKDGRVLIAGGYEAPRSAEIYDPATGKFAKTGDLNTDRSGHTATLLLDGRVQVAGGEPDADLRGGSPGNSVETYNPATGGWTVEKPMLEGVQYHTATLLDNGKKVLVAGGRIPVNSLLITDNDTSQLYDSLFDVWTRCPSEATATPACPAPLLQGRYWNPATLLADGRILAAGGVKANGGVVRSTAELYDPGRGVWTQTGRMGQARYYHTAARLPNGKVLVAGGASRRNYHFRGGALNSAELYDPATGRWSWAPFMPEVQTGIDSDEGPVRVFDTLPGVTLPTGPWAACAANCGKVLVVRSDLQSGPGDRSLSGAGLRSLLFSPTPEVSALSPASGPVSGGTPVTITGTGLASVSSVKFDGVEAQRVEPDGENPDGKLVAVSPPHAAGAVDLTITADGGSSAAVPAARFTYGQDPAPGPGPDGGSPSSGGTQGTTPGTQQGGRPTPGGAPSVTERTALERCLAGAKRQKTKSRRRAARARCLTPGRVSRLTAKALSASAIRLTFSAPGSVGRSAPPAGRFVVKQSPRPIKSERDFGRARTLCKGVCRFGPTRVGQRITLTVTGLRPRARYYYAVKAVGASGRTGPRSKTAKATTRGTKSRR
jgi:hypothetical protein